MISINLILNWLELDQLKNKKSYRVQRKSLRGAEGQTE